MKRRTDMNKEVKAPEWSIDPPYAVAEYASTTSRAPQYPPVWLPAGPTERSGPLFTEVTLRPEDADLTAQHDDAPLGERIHVSGHVLDADGEPIARQLVEIWQANAAGRYAHEVDQHPAPLDPNFTGAGRCLTDDDGCYRFTTIKPGAYPWGNHTNAWRPAHIHFSVFGPSFNERLVTQMYFPGDPLLGFDPIFNAVVDPSARERLIAAFDWPTTEEGWALGYRFDITVADHLGTQRDAP
jgi:protocatechuate 3,4-dioxygenase beta subunit